MAVMPSGCNTLKILNASILSDRRLDVNLPIHKKHHHIICPLAPPPQKWYCVVIQRKLSDVFQINAITQVEPVFENKFVLNWPIIPLD